MPTPPGSTQHKLEVMAADPQSVSPFAATKLEENPLLPLDTQANLVYTLTRLFRMLAQVVNPLVEWAVSMVEKWKNIYPVNSTTTTLVIDGPATGGGAQLLLNAKGDAQPTIKGAYDGVGAWNILMGATQANNRNFYIQRLKADGTWDANILQINKANNQVDWTAQVITQSAQAGWTVHRMQAIGGQGTSFEFWAGGRVYASYQLDSNGNPQFWVTTDNTAVARRAIYIDHNSGRVSLESGGLAVSGVNGNDSINATGVITTNQRFYSGGWQGVHINGTNGDGSTYRYQDLCTGNPQWNNAEFRLWHQFGQWAGFMMQSEGGAPNTIHFVLSNGGPWGSINAAAFNVQSDERIKDLVEPLPQQHDAYMGIKPISWHWPEPPAPKDGDPPVYADTRPKWGFSAQNIAMHVPYAVNGNVLAEDADGKPLSASVDPVPILALTTLEVQALWQRITTLEDRIAALEN